MADRSCAVILVNDTPFQLSLAGRFDLEHGKWEVLPPDIVEPGQKVVWKSASKTAALFGSQGHVEYQIKGNQPGIFFKVKDVQDKPSVGGFLRIDFESPFSGVPHCTANIHASSDTLEIPNDPNDFYQVMTGYMGRTDDRDFGEELIESLQVGPLEIVLSWLGTPEHHPFFFVRLQMRVPVVDHRKPASLMTDFPDPRPLSMKPVLNGSVEAWIGKWRLTLPDNTSDVLLDISASAGDRSYAISLEDKTRSITTHFKEIPLTRSAIVDYTGNTRKEPPVPVTGTHPSFAKIHLSGIGAGPINTHTETEGGPQFIATCTSNFQDL
jgi:hypothetical protein